MGKHNIDQRSHVNKRIIHQKMIIKVVLNRWEMPHFKSWSVFSKNVNMQFYNNMQLDRKPKHFLKIEKINMAQYLVILPHVINVCKVLRLIIYLNESSTIHVSY